MKTLPPNRTRFRNRFVRGAFFPILTGSHSLLLLIGGAILFAVAPSAQFLPSRQGLAAAASPQKQAAEVLFVGCKSDGQVGPGDVPTGKDLLLPINIEVAQRLAYYKSEQGVGVLAPRGWQCFGVYGSNGYALYVSPAEIVPANLLSSRWSGFDGQVIEIAGSNGDTSGRFTVARTIARVFPTHRDFVENVIAEGIEPASAFPFGPYPDDKLNYRNKEMVEYETPANKDGLGTNSRLKKNDEPIRGVAILAGETPDLLLLSIRLSRDPTNLTAAIVQQVERDSVPTASNR
jgi:hypothetical protein